MKVLDPLKLDPTKPYLIQWFYTTVSITSDFIRFVRMNYDQYHDERTKPNVTVHGPFATFRQARLKALAAYRKRYELARHNWRLVSRSTEAEIIDAG